MLTKYPAAALAWSHVHNACADAAPDSALHDRERDAKPVGTRCCKNAGTNVHGEGRKLRSNPADDTAGPKNLCPGTVCAGPRAAQSRQLTPLAAHAAAADDADFVLGDGRGHSRLPDTPGWHANAANAGPSVDTPHCSNEIANAAAKIAVRIL